MKSILYIYLILITTGLCAQSHHDVTKMDINTQNFKKVHLYNTGGEVRVTSTSERSGNVIVHRTINTKSASKLSKAVEEIFFDSLIVDNELFLFVNNPYQTLEPHSSGNYMHYRYNYQGDGKQYWDGIQSLGVDYKFEIEMNLPKATNLVVHTHKGVLNVEDIQGSLIALNHHDDILLKDVLHLEQASSHHGDVEVSFAKEPEDDIVLDTHHGDIKVKFKDTPSAMLELYSYHGSFYTDFNYKSAPLVTVASNSKHRTKYKVGSKTRVTMGDGGKKISFDSHHGDMYILKY